MSVQKVKISYSSFQIILSLCFSTTHFNRIICLHFQIKQIQTNDLLYKLITNHLQINHGSRNDAIGAGQAVRQGLDQIGEAMHEAGPEGVHEDRRGDGHRLRPHGIHWLLRQTHSHSHQQHHRRRLTTPDSHRLFATTIV